MSNELNQNESKISDARSISKWTMVLAGLVVIGYNVFVVIKTGRIPAPDEQQSILMLGGGLMGIFSPVYVSIWLDKIFGKRNDQP